MKARTFCGYVITCKKTLVRLYMKIVMGAGMRKLIFKFMWLYYTAGVVTISSYS